MARFQVKKSQKIKWRIFLAVVTQKHKKERFQMKKTKWCGYKEMPGARKGFR